MLQLMFSPILAGGCTQLSGLAQSWKLLMHGDQEKKEGHHKVGVALPTTKCWLHDHGA
jgi:hypothetical protein